MKIADVVRKLLFGTPVGDVIPRRDDPSIETRDGRGHAVRVLRSYLEELTFFRSNPGGFPIPFTVKPTGDGKRRVLLEQADDNEDLVLPTIVLSNPASAEHLACAFQPYPIESTRDVYGRGTVLWNLGTDYVELLNLEVWAAGGSERGAILRGLRQAFSPLEGRVSLKLKVPSYYDQVATFTLLRGQNLDGENALGRSRATLSIELRFTEVELVNYVRLRPVIDTDASTGT